MEYYDPPRSPSYTNNYAHQQYQYPESPVPQRFVLSCLTRGHREGGRLGSAKKSKTPFF